MADSWKNFPILKLRALQSFQAAPGAESSRNVPLARFGIRVALSRRWRASACQNGLAFFTETIRSMSRNPFSNSESSSRGGEPAPARVSLAGCLLAAHIDVVDPMFSRGVCLIVEHTDEATVGIMLNRPLAMDPNPFWKTLFEGKPSIQGGMAGHFNFGGPQNGPIVAIHSDSTLAEGGNGDGIYVSAQVETLQKLAETAPEHLRWFIGHAVWEKSRLEQEIVEGKWHVLPTIPQIVFSEEGRMWPEAIRFLGRSVISSFPGVDQFPAHPLLN